VWTFSVIRVCGDAAEWRAVVGDGVRPGVAAVEPAAADVVAVANVATARAIAVAMVRFIFDTPIFQMT
jgi:hypothetical protein